MKDYIKKAEDFLKQTETTLTVKFKKHDRYFADDKEPRDIFSCMLKNKKHKFRFEFGQNTFSSDGQGGNPPSAYDILSCIEKFPVGTFESFCDEFGYNSDSRKDYKLYKSVKRASENVLRLFSDEQLEQLREIN